jgi:hypothetical protein
MKINESFPGHDQLYSLVALDNSLLLCIKKKQPDLRPHNLKSIWTSSNHKAYITVLLLSVGPQLCTILESSEPLK